MFHFDFTFPSILILLIFLYFFLSEPRLPVRKNRLFFLLVLVELLVLLFDILSSNADMNYQDLPIWLTAVLNMAYFVFFLARILLYFFYTLNILRRFPDVRSPAMLLYSSVFLISELLVLSSFRTGAVFLIDQNGYHRGPLYNIIYVCFFFYLLLSFLFIFLERKKLSRRDLISIVGCNVILLCGYIVRMLMPQYLVLNVFYLMALLVIFISFENPAVYTTSYGSFSFPALREYLEFCPSQLFRRPRDLRYQTDGTGHPADLLLYQEGLPLSPLLLSALRLLCSGRSREDGRPETGG